MRPTAGCFVIALALAVTFASAPAAWPDSREVADTVVTSIQVRGHWVIQVADPDGTVVTLREFHNALTPPGETALVYLLAGNRSAGGFAVELAPQSVSPCAPNTCRVAEPRFLGVAGPSVAKTLTKTVSSNAIVLRGSIADQRPATSGGSTRSS